MPRSARSVLEGIPYHVTARGNRSGDVFFNDEDRRRYLGWLHDYSERFDLDVLAYCLMSNHVHLIVTPQASDAIARTLQTLQARHSQCVNARIGWSGHLWHGRFFSTALDDVHLWYAVRYVEMNPVRAGLVTDARDYPWSSAAHHLGIRRDRVIRSSSEWGGPVEGWEKELRSPEDEAIAALIRTRTKTGFPCGDEAFLATLSAALGREFVVRRVGRPRK